MRALLTSTGFVNRNALNWLQRGISTFSKSRPKAAVVVTASEKKKNNKYAISALDDLKSIGLDAFLYDFDEDPLLELEAAQIIYICGGNTFDLMGKINQSGGRKLLLDFFEKKNTILIGVSAGACILGSKIDHLHEIGMDEINHEYESLKTFSLIDKMIVPHFESSLSEKMAAKGYVDYLAIENGQLYCYDHQAEKVEPIA